MTLNRRRFLLVAAGTAIVGSTGSGWGWPELSKSRVTWEGVSLGARAQILVNHADREEASDCLAACRKEIDRLEALFSLYRHDSAIARLNAGGSLEAPDPDFLRLLSTAAAVHAATDGAFDPTVQALWEAYARSHTGATTRVAESELADALTRTGLRHVRFDPSKIAFAKPGMGMTFNGIAQGYITDRIAALFRARGFRSVLVDVGEIRAVGPQHDGRGWPVKIAGGSRIVSLKDRALATSAALGTTFDSQERVGHILDPRSGRAMTVPRHVTISAPTAALADALSTALCILPPRSAAEVLGTFPEAHVVDA